MSEQYQPHNESREFELKAFDMLTDAAAYRGKGGWRMDINNHTYGLIAFGMNGRVVDCRDLLDSEAPVLIHEWQISKLGLRKAADFPIELHKQLFLSSESPMQTIRPKADLWIDLRPSHIIAAAKSHFTQRKPAQIEDYDDLGEIVGYLMHRGVVASDSDRRNWGDLTNDERQWDRELRQR